MAKEQAHLVLGFQGVGFASQDRFPLEVLAYVLSGQGGRLFTEIREKRALAYRVSAFSVEGLDPGYFAVYLASSPENLDEAVKVVRHELHEVAERASPPTNWRARSATSSACTPSGCSARARWPRPWPSTRPTVRAGSPTGSTATTS
jgi:predicted Zn-dependent peptidase